MLNVMDFPLSDHLQEENLCNGHLHRLVTRPTVGSHWIIHRGPFGVCNYATSSRIFTLSSLCTK